MRATCHAQAFMILMPQQSLAKTVIYEALPYEVFCIHLSLHLFFFFVFLFFDMAWVLPSPCQLQKLLHLS
jgi:hypothetical protein